MVPTLHHYSGCQATRWVMLRIWWTTSPLHIKLVRTMNFILWMLCFQTLLAQWFSHCVCDGIFFITTIPRCQRCDVHFPIDCATCGIDHGSYRSCDNSWGNAVYLFVCGFTNRNYLINHYLLFLCSSLFVQFTRRDQNCPVTKLSVCHWMIMTTQTPEEAPIGGWCDWNLLRYHQ